jgi:zinc protease
MAVQEYQIPYVKERARKITFQNGHTLVYVPKRGDVFNISTWVKTGSIHEDDEINGISHFLEHLLFKGTERFKPGEFDRKMESMGAIINAATWKDFTFYYITGPKDPSGSNFDTALDMHADMMIHSTLPDSEIGPQYNPDDPDYKGEKRERAVVIEEIGMREDQPWTKVYNAVNHMMYPDSHPYQRDVIGTRQIIGNVPREKIVGYYKTWYSPHNMTTIVVGDFDFDELCAKVQRSFDFQNIPDLDNGKLVTEGPALSTNGKRFVEIKGEYQTSFFIIGFHGPKPQELKETIALDVASYILGEGRSARMVQELLEKPEKPIFNSLSSGQSTYKLGNVFYIQGNFNGADSKPVLDMVWNEINKMLTTQPITEEELRRTLKKLKLDFAETSETVSGIAETVGESLTVIGDFSHYTEYLNVLETLDLATVQAVAKKYMDPEKAFTSVLVPADVSKN